MSFVQVCPVQPVDSVCPEPLVWVETAKNLPLSADAFLQMLPVLVTMLLFAWGIKQLLRMVFNR